MKSLNQTIYIMENNKKQNIIIIVAMILIAAATRFMPHPPNFTALGAMGLFGGAYFSKKYLAFIVPFAALWMSDLVLNNIFYAQYYDHFVWFTTGSIWIYMAFAAIVLLGMGLLKKVNLQTVVGTSILASTIFFILTNFGVWASGTMYPMNLAGLGACFAAGIPFFPNTLMGDLLFSGLLFGSYEFFMKRQFAKAVS